MSIKDMTPQELADGIHDATRRAITLARQAERVACNAEIGAVVAPVSEGLGYLQLAHGAFTSAAEAMPDVKPKYGGGK